MKWLGLVLGMLASSALAGPVDDAARPCLVERLDRAKAACLEAIADQRIAKTEGRIAVATVDMQAASARQLQRFEQDLDVSQHFWRDRMESACRSDDLIEFQMCRLASAIRRDQTVRDVLADARAEMGLMPIIEVPENIEVLIPLPGAPAGPVADFRVPLIVPIKP